MRLYKTTQIKKYESLTIHEIMVYLSSSMMFDRGVHKTTLTTLPKTL